MTSKIWNPGIFFGGFRNPVLYAESHKWLEYGIPSSTGRESGITQPFPQGFSLKKWKSPGDEVGNYLEPANLESMEWNPESRIQDFPSWIITMISPRLHFFFCLCELSDNRHLQWLEVYITKSVFFKSLYSHLQELFLRSLKYPINYAVCCRQKLAFHWYQILILNPNI